MRKTVTFYGTTTAQGELTLVSDRIGHPYTMKRVRVSFPAGSINLHQVSIYIDQDETAPSSGKPGGISVFADYGQVDYLVGEGEVVELAHVVDVPWSNSWIKVYGNNADFYDHALNVQVEIETAERSI